jgi:hypothetical protein
MIGGALSLGNRCIIDYTKFYRVIRLAYVLDTPSTLLEPLDDVADPVVLGLVMEADRKAFAASFQVELSEPLETLKVFRVRLALAESDV